MFNGVKVNQNGIMNLIKNVEPDKPGVQPGRQENDFYSMVMENTGYRESRSLNDSDLRQKSENEKTHDKQDPVRNEQNSMNEHRRSVNSNEREPERADRGKERHENPDKDLAKNASRAGDNARSSETTAREVKSIKSSVKNSIKSGEDEISILNQIQVLSNLKILADIVKAAFSGNKKAEEDNFQKLHTGVRQGLEKERKWAVKPAVKEGTDTGHKIVSDLISSVSKEMKDVISKEILKNADNKKYQHKPEKISDKELREIAANIIDSIKKGKTKETVKHEMKHSLNDDSRIDKKTPVIQEQQTLRKTETSDDSAFDKNGFKDRNSSKENFTFNSARVDFSGKSSMEKTVHNIKMPEFRENLQEIIDKARVTVRDSRNGSFTVRLNPKELGDVNVNLVMENGVIRGKFLVDNEDVKSALLNNLNDIRNQLEEAGISVGEFSVNVNDQREKYLRDRVDENFHPLSLKDSEREIVTAADLYNTAAAAHNGHINMVI